MIDIFYCADGNRRFAEIAIDAGFKYGAQLPNTVYFWPEMADQDWKKPDREKYMNALALHRPHVATVLDWEQPEQLGDVLAWAEDAAQFVEVVMIIPKVIGGIEQIPRQIGGKPVRLGYSVPTKFGGTQVPAWEFYGWPVHLLGGSPKKQYEIARYIDVVSADGNYSQLMATKYCEFWDGKRWQELEDFGGKVEKDAPYEAFRRSCQNIMVMWAGLPMLDRPDSRAVGE